MPNNLVTGGFIVIPLITAVSIVTATIMDNSKKTCPHVGWYPHTTTGSCETNSIIGIIPITMTTSMARYMPCLISMQQGDTATHNRALSLIISSVIRCYELIFTRLFIISTRRRKSVTDCLGVHSPDLARLLDSVLGHTYKSYHLSREGRYIQSW